MKVTTTGIKTLDEWLMNGIPLGYTTLITGNPGAGIELFAKQFAGSHEEDENVVYFTTAERDEDIVSIFNNFKWKSDIKIVNIGSIYYRTVLEKELEISKYREEGIPAGELLTPTRYTPSKKVDFMTMITYEISKLKPPFRLIIDSLDFFLTLGEQSRMIASLRTIKSHTQHNDGTALITMLSSFGSQSVEMAIEEIVDIIFSMEMIRSETGIERLFTIKKFRNHPEKAGIFRYEVTDTGINIKPFK